MKKFCFSSKMMILAIVSLSAFELCGDYTFKDCVVPYFATQRIAITLCGKEQVFSSNKKKRKIEWRKNIEDDLKEAKLHKYNSDRLDMLDDFINSISDQYYGDPDEFDRAVEEVSSKCLEPAANRNDLIWAMAIAVRLNIFCIKHVIPHISDSDLIKEELDNAFNGVKDKIRERYEDATLRGLVSEYKKLFPKKNLLFEQTLPSNFDDCVKLHEKCLNAYMNLDKYSASAEFSEWGENMLNFLILSYDVLFIKEFEERMKSYKNNFQSK